MGPTVDYPRGDILVEVGWLRQQLGAPGLKLLDARGSKEHASGHLPGAIALSANAFKAPGSQDPVSADEFARAAGALGIRASDTVVCYDDVGPLGARAWWAFERYGHREVRFLNGGLRAWLTAGYPLVTGTPVAEPEPAVYQLAGARDELMCSLAGAVAALGQDQVVFWDTRTAAEYAGEVHPFAPPPRPGHIPGAVQLEWSDLIDLASGRFKAADQMRQVLESKGIRPESDVITY